MARSGTRFIPSEYRVVWDALTHYGSYLESRAPGAEGDNERLKFYELLEDDGAKKSLAAGAQADFELKLEP